ncbi:MAG: hypothetical protein AAFX99_11630, partial [Myxococcota bacterium]
MEVQAGADGCNGRIGHNWLLGAAKSLSPPQHGQAAASSRTPSLELIASPQGQAIVDIRGFNLFQTPNTDAIKRGIEDLSVFGGLQLLPVVGLGESEGDFGEDSSTFGFAFEAAARYALPAGLYVQGGYRIQVF